MKLKQLKSLIDEQAPSLLSEFSSRKDAIAYLKLKVILIFTHVITLCATLSCGFSKLNRFFSQFLTDVGRDLVVAAGAKWEIYCGGKEDQSRI